MVGGGGWTGDISSQEEEKEKVGYNLGTQGGSKMKDYRENVNEDCGGC